MKKIDGVIFDWAGTTVDFGCFAPLHAFLQVFKDKKVPITVQEARAPMGLLKIDHIREILKTPRVQQNWLEEYHRAFTEEDIKALYESFEQMLFSSLREYAEPLPGVLETIGVLRERGIKIGSTTGYTYEMMSIVAKKAEKRGYFPDSLVTPDHVASYGRPYPYMIYRNMFNLTLQAAHSVVKVGDTKSDIKEGINAGVWSVGSIIGSSEMGLSYNEFSNLSDEQREENIARTKKIFIDAGADFTINSINELPDLLEKINLLLAEGKKPNAR